jgi:hypothetical protein
LFKKRHAFTKFSPLPNRIQLSSRKEEREIGQQGGFVLLVRWLRKKAKTSSKQQFIDTPLVGSHTHLINQNASILDH